MGNDGRSRASTATEAGGVTAGLLGGVMAKLDNMIREYGTAHRRVNWACIGELERRFNEVRQRDVRLVHYDPTQRPTMALRFILRCSLVIIKLKFLESNRV